MAKDPEYKKIITSARWLHVRKSKLTTTPLCERCAAKGRVRAATEVHHINPVERGLSYEEKERLAFNLSNLQSLCHECHVLIHTEMGRSGKAQSRAAAADKLQKFKEKFL